MDFLLAGMSVIQAICGYASLCSLFAGDSGTGILLMFLLYVVTAIKFLIIHKIYPNRIP
jgi:hypothetical protein